MKHTFLSFHLENKQLLMLKYENKFIDLGRALVQSIEVGKFEYGVCKVCLVEMVSMIKFEMLTPLMLKKNPEIVKWVEKLCHFTERKRLSCGQFISEESRSIRSLSTEALNSFKKLMNFDRTNDEFMQFFYDNVKLFHELTANIPHIQKRQLTIDPELNLMIDDPNDA